MIDQSKNYYIFQKCLGDLSVLISQIESQFSPPKFVSVSGQQQFRYSENTVYHIAFLKTVRMVSGLNASVTLLPGGYYQEKEGIKSALDA
jgi:hypothetical protein